MTDLTTLSNEELLSHLPKKARDIKETELTTFQLIYFAEYCRRNMQPQGTLTYDRRMVDIILPELFKRFQDDRQADIDLFGEEYNS